MTQGQEKTRYYVHGDLREGGADYYCAFCDLFQPGEHFYSGAHTNHYARYLLALKAHKERVKQGKPYTRPANPTNIVA